MAFVIENFRAKVVALSPPELAMACSLAGVLANWGRIVDAVKLPAPIIPSTPFPADTFALGNVTTLSGALWVSYSRIDAIEPDLRISP